MNPERPTEQEDMADIMNKDERQNKLYLLLLTNIVYIRNIYPTLRNEKNFNLIRITNKWATVA